MTAGSPSDAASAAIERLRGLRVQARQQRDQVREAVRQVRARNHEESMQAMLRVRAARRPGAVWPTSRPERQMHLFDQDFDSDRDNLGGQPAGPPNPSPGRTPSQQPPPARRPPHVDDDDWSNETWLH